ncbi:MAG: hypothetical protein FWB77_01360 [Treponema sp.]|nr:hypothetical protein [Treponema sp.]
MQQIELQDFINETLNNRKAPHKWIKIGIVNNKTQNMIERKFGLKVSKIHIDNSSIIHAITQTHHNLESDDLLYTVNIINSPDNINLSAKKYKSCDVLIFKKDIYGEITVLTEVHTKNNYLLVFDVWRLKKARRDPDAT